MTVRIEPITPEMKPDLEYICQNMRQIDKEEIYAHRFNDCPVALTDDTMRISGFSWLFYKDDKPVAILGAFPLWPKHWSVFAFATDAYKSVVLSMTKQARRVVFPVLMEGDGEMAFAWALSANTTAIRWMESLGAIEAARVPKFGRDGQEFKMMAWYRDRMEGYVWRR